MEDRDLSSQNMWDLTPIEHDLTTQIYQ